MRFVAVGAIVAAITAFYFKFVHVNPTTVAMTFLVAVLVISARWELRYAVTLSILATLCFNLFFLPPFGTFTIADPQNWVALLVFLVTAIIASQLSERARRETVSADRRRREAERLYHFSQQLLLSENVLALSNAIPRQVVDSFSATAVAIFLASSKKVYYSDLASQSLVGADELKAVSSRGEPVLDHNRALYFMPLHIGVRSIGSLAIVGGALSPETIEAIASLIAIALERASAVEQLSKAEAERHSDRLRAALLDAVTHQFRTPLTGIMGSVTALLSDLVLDESQKRELLTVIEEESKRLNRLVGEATEMAQLDAGQVQLQLEPHQISEAVEAALEHSKQALAGHPVEVNFSPDLPPVRMDIERIREVLSHLLENAAKYSQPGAAIHVTSELIDHQLRTSVADHGPGIDDFEQSLIFDKFYRGRQQRVSVQGTGMGLAISKAIVEAHGGNIGVTSQLEHGSVFYFSLPL